MHNESNKLIFIQFCFILLLRYYRNESIPSSDLIIKSAEVCTCIFRVKFVFINDESCAVCLHCVAAKFNLIKLRNYIYQFIIWFDA